MVNRLVSVGDDFKLPAAVKVEDPNLPARLSDTSLTATIVTQAKDDTPLRGAVANAPLSPAIRPPKALLALTFDDSPAADYTVIRPLLESRGVRGTFATLISAMGTNETRWAQLREMVANGHEVVNHSATHVQLDSASDAVLDAEITGAHNTMVSRGITPKGFIAPNNAGSVKTREYARKLGYRYSMGGDQGLGGANAQPLQTFGLSRYPFGNTTTLAAVQTQIDAAKTGKHMLSYVIHAGTLDATGQSVLGQAIDYAIAQGVEVVTVSKGLDLIGNVYDSGDIGGDYVKIDGMGKLHSTATNKAPDVIVASKVRDSAPASGGLLPRTLTVNDQRLTLGFHKQFTGGGAQTATIPLPAMPVFGVLVLDLTIISQQFYTNAGTRCVYGAKVFVAVGSADSTRVVLHPYLAAAGFSTAPAITITRDTVTKAASLNLTFTSATVDDSGAITATIPV